MANTNMIVRLTSMIEKTEEHLVDMIKWRDSRYTSPSMRDSLIEHIAVTVSYRNELLAARQEQMDRRNDETLEN